MGGTKNGGSNDNIDCCGVILHTTDEGLTWDTTILESCIRSICFLDPDTGFAASNQSFFYKTTDGGVSWETIVVTTPIFGIDPYNYFTSLHFNNSKEGFMSGHTGYAQRLTYRTYDGGNTWESMIPVIGYPNDAVSGGEVCFPSSSTGYIGNRYKTVNGGVTWFRTDSMITPNPEGGYIDICNEFLTDKFGYIGGPCITPISGTYNSGFISVTFDGGINWEYSYFQGVRNVYDIEIVDESMVYAVTSYASSEAVTNTSHILVSFDYGSNWYYQALEADTLLWRIRRIHAVDDKTAYAVGYAASYLSGVIYKTENAGGQPLSLVETQSDKELLESLLNVFPNPANTSINIQCGFVIDQIEIYNISGELLQSVAVASNKQEIDISTFSTGTYFVKVLGKGELAFGRFIKL